MRNASPVRRQENRLLIVAGETSGDQHGAHLLGELLKRKPGLEVWSVGGDRLKNAGSTQIVSLNELSVIGLMEVFRKAWSILRAYRRVLQTVDREGIQTAILIDYPDFNLRLARSLKKRGIRVFYYISPQVWAWRKSRIHQIKRDVDHMFVIFPFEKDLYVKEDVPVTYVGHPLLDEPFPVQSQIELRQNLFSPEAEIDMKDVRVIGLLPGSRESELTRLYPRMLEAFDRLKKEFPEIRAVVPQAPGLPDHLFERFEEKYPWTRDNRCFRRVFNRFRETVKLCDLVVLASGTATLETALLGVPMVIVYMMNPLTYHLARRLVRVPAIGMVNLIAGKTIMPELIQDQATPQNIAGHLKEFLSDPGKLLASKGELEKVKASLGHPGASERLTDCLVGLMNGAKTTPATLIEPGQRSATVIPEKKE